MNTTILKNMKTSVPTDLMPLMPGYLKRREEEVEMLMARLEARDFENIHMIAHKLTGNGTGYGIPAITELGREMSAAAKALNAPLILECVGQLRDLVQDLKVKLLNNKAA